MSRITCPHCGGPLELAKPRGPKPGFDEDIALGALKLGATPTEVARAFGVSSQRIHALARKRGLV